MLDLTQEIKKHLTKIDINFSEEQVKQLNTYVNLLDKWNKAYNLTAVRNINEMVERHIVDSLSIVNYITGERFIDVGTGPGLPGIPLAIMYPNKQFFLLDSNGKKTRFLHQAKMELLLENVQVINQRVEEYQPEQLFDGILSRAFSTLIDMLKTTEHLCQEEGHFFAMKGVYPETELQQIKKPYKVQKIDWLDNQVERHLVIISQKIRG